MKPIGIIANPASGKDIRRLVAYGSVFDNAEKTNIVMIALDGEREINAYQGDKLTVRLNPEGPWVVDVAGVLSIASINKHFITIG